MAQTHNKNQNAACGSSDAFSTRPFAGRYEHFRAKIFIFLLPVILGSCTGDVRSIDPFVFKLIAETELNQYEDTRKLIEEFARVNNFRVWYNQHSQKPSPFLYYEGSMKKTISGLGVNYREKPNRLYFSIFFIERGFESCEHLAESVFKIYKIIDEKLEAKWSFTKYEKPENENGGTVKIFEPVCHEQPIVIDKLDILYKKIPNDLS